MRLTRAILIVVAVIGLAVDAWIHLTLASAYDGVRATVSQGQLFRIEGIAAIVVALALVIRPSRVVYVLVLLVAGGGLFALLLYRYVDVGKLGPLPNMYEPAWYGRKVWTTIAQAVTTVCAIVLLLLPSPARQAPGATPTS